MRGLRLDEGSLGARRNIPEFGLVRGWRLVENQHVHDVHRLSDIEVPECGVELVFFSSQRLERSRPRP
eukprot:2441077-Pyramimonas_sp.AAC.1